ncbi:MAG: hypothetical protein JSS38_14060 [Nitrospira sp.]|nr:hypothetical protein [Nitrospira sp.]MBS0155718.1 hypothetical protein [Nitrospira sp.]MBS0164512.1 hypothetical protein [Nitrospira sp.]
MKTSWGTKSPNKRRRVVLRTKVRWEKLGLQDPTGSLSAPSIDDLRRQIASAASQGLSPDTVSRSQQQGGRSAPGTKRPGTTRKRKTAS